MGSGGEPNWVALLPLAQEPERRMTAWPVLDTAAEETWDEFKARQAGSEAGLLRKLSRLPGCVVTSNRQGLMATLLLAGVEVRSYDGLVGTCREWIARVRLEALRAAEAGG